MFLKEVILILCMIWGREINTIYIYNYEDNDWYKLIRIIVFIRIQDVFQIIQKIRF